MSPAVAAPTTRPAGMFISLEGIDGAGKSSHLDRLQATLEASGHRVLRTREPGGTELAEELRRLVLHRSMDAWTEALLVFAARREHAVRVIRPALLAGQIVLSDRFADATFAYQGAGRGFDWDKLLELEQLTLSDCGLDGQNVLKPQLTLWFDLPPLVAAARLAQARDPDKFEAQSATFFERVRSGYARRRAEDPQRFVLIDADRPPEAVWQQVAQAVQGRGLLA